MLDLVSYDTVKTLRGLVANVLRAQAIEEKNRSSRAAYKSNNNSLQHFSPPPDQDGKISAGERDHHPRFGLYTQGVPKVKLTDDSLTLGDLGLCPNGVLHVSKR